MFGNSTPNKDGPEEVKSPSIHQLQEAGVELVDNKTNIVTPVGDGAADALEKAEEG